MNMRSVQFASLYLLSVTLAVTLSPRTSADPRDTSVVPGEILIGYASGRLQAARASEAIGQVGQVAGVDNRLSAVRVRLRPGVSIEAAIARLAGQAGILYAEPNHYVKACATPNDPDYKTWQYAPQITRANLSWDIWKPREKVVVAVVDTGVESTHVDLTSIMYRNASGAVIGWNTLNNSANANDDSGHGTHSAGTALAHINDGKGPAGIAGWNPNVAGSDTYAKIMPVKALNSSGVGTDASIAAGITWAADNGAQVINISASSSSPSTTMSNAVQYAWNKGCVIVAAAGNEASDAPEYPAAYPNVLSVAATDETDTLLFFSQYGSWIKCAAPGSNIYSTYRGGAYSGMSGTSTACAHVAAEAAAILAQNPTLKNGQVNDLICSQVDPVLPYLGQSLGAGVGRVNIYRALLAAGDGNPTLTTVSFNPAVIPNQSTSSGSVSIGGPAPAGGLVISLRSSNIAIATVPASVTIPAGATSVDFVATGKLVDVNSTATITATSGGNSVSGQLTVSGSVASKYTINPTSVDSGNNFVGTITLDAPAKTGGAVVTLTDNSNGILSTPSTVTVPEGATSANYTGRAGTVTRRTSVYLTATLNGGSASVSLMINLPSVGLSGLTISPATVVGGKNATGTVTLGSAAPTGGTVVALISSNTTAAKVPLSVTVSAGQTTATFTITTSVVTTSKSPTITATAGGVSKSASLKVTPMLKAVTVSPTAVYGGARSVGKVTIATAAPAGGAVIALSSSSSVASVPSSVTVPEGATYVTFNITTDPVAVNTVATITATYAGARATAKLTVKAPVVSKISLSPTTVVGGASSKATIVLTAPAPAGGTVVTLSSSNAVADVPASITVPAGATSAIATVTTSAVSANTLATITAATGTTTRSAGLTVTP